jgi:hypothetical protein
MKDCFMGLRSGGGWLTFCAAIVSSSTSNSSSSSSTLSLGFYRMIRSISVSIGWTVGFLDRSPCMNRMKFGNYSSFITAVLMSLELRLIAEGCALDRSWLAINRSNRDSSATELEQQRNGKLLFFFFSKVKTELKLTK